MNNEATTITPLADDISVGDLGKLVGGSPALETPAAEPAPPAPPQTEEPSAPEAAAAETPATEPEKKTEAEEQTAEKQQETEKPERKKSSIDQRLSQVSRARREAEKALAEERERREKLERELEALKTSPPGPAATPETQPVPKPGDPGGDPMPKLKSYVDKIGDDETYEDAVDRFNEDLEKWRERQGERKVQQRTRAEAEESQRKTFLKDWEEAMAERPDFEDTVKEVAQAAPEGLQVAISQLRRSDGKALWPAVTIYLSEHPEELRQLGERFAENPLRAYADLGRIAARIEQPPAQPAPKTPAAQPPRPAAAKPPSVVGGTSAPAPVDLEKIRDMDTFVREMKRRGL